MRHSTADQRTDPASAWLESASARPHPTRREPPLPTISAGTVRHLGGCLQPVLLRGRADYIDGRTGELIHRHTTVHEPGGVLPTACKTRRASRCPPCAEVYRVDTYQLIRAGLIGGKGIPATVADHPCVFVTLTAPSFGPVHARREKNGRVLACRAKEPLADSERGSNLGALGGTRTPNLLIRSQMLYPLSYERSHSSILHSEPCR